MSRSIYKYQLDISDTPMVLNMPNGAFVVHVAFQDETLCLWAEVDLAKFFGEDLVPRWFVVHGTGHEFDHDGHYVGTALAHTFVWHVYEVKP